MLLDVIKNRKSIRKFTDESVSKDDLEQIIMAAKHSPTARNSQQRLYTVLESESSMEKLYRAIDKVVDRENYNFYGAKAFIIVSVPKDYPFGDVDSACALENMMLQCTYMGLGSVWINQLRDACKKEAVRDVLDEFKIPKDHVIYGSLAIGHPADDPEPKIRNEKVVFVD